MSLFLALRDMIISNSFIDSSVLLKTLVFLIMSKAPTDVTFVL